MVIQKRFLITMSVFIFLGFFLIAGCNNIKDNGINSTMAHSSKVKSHNQNKTNNNDVNSVKYCFTTNKDQPVQYIYYFKDGAIYTKATTENSYVEKSWENNKFCFKNKKALTCLNDPKKEFYKSLKDEYVLNTQTLANAMNIKCKTIPYKKDLFEIN